MSEILPKKEITPGLRPEKEPVNFEADKTGAFAVFEARERLLESLKPSLSRKYYFFIEEKILQQRHDMKRILDWKQGGKDAGAKYTNILDSYYFEQKLLIN